jgi:NAD(P) transhydrogenase subunit alpha
VTIKIAVLKETAKGENRVSATPETVKKMLAAGLKVEVEAGAGASASYTDAAYKDAGANVQKDLGKMLKDAHVIFCVQNPPKATLAKAAKNAVVIGALAPHNFDKDIQKSYAARDLTAMAMELMPRITRAQSMDILSSQANLAGYRAVIEAAFEFGQAFPMMMTAAGTISPARVFVMGAGVAGLQAIATARRLGAVVSATDVRPAAKEQVQSLGASFVMVENEETKAAETSGGYAKEMSAAYKKEQAKLIAETIAKQDIVITTALIPGRPAPELVSEDMVKSMKPGSVIVDLATAQGGNCALSKAGEVIEKYDVKIIGHDNMAARIAVDTSALYARNLWTFLQTILSEEKDALKLDIQDEILSAITLTFEGAPVHSLLIGEKKATTKKAKAKKASTKKDEAVLEEKDSPAKPAAKKAKAKAPAKKASTTAKKTVAKKAASKKAAPKKTSDKAALVEKEAPNKKAAPKATAKKPAKKAGTNAKKTAAKTTKTTAKKAVTKKATPAKAAKK